MSSNRPLSLWTRRNWLRAGVCAAAMSPRLLTAKPHIDVEPPLTVGLIADLHFGLEPTAEERLRHFMGTLEEQNPDMIIQLGDFNYGDRESRVCTELWNSFGGPRYHVLGNHDMDRHGKQHMVDQWQMPGRYYSFDRGGIHFVVIDRNNLRTADGYVAYDKANFYVDGQLRGFADPQQLAWLREDLRTNRLPAVVLSHQGLGIREAGVEGHPAAVELEELFAEHNRTAVSGKIVACLCGHHHVDRYQFRDGIHYLWINSISYHWVGADYGRMAVYRDPLYCYLTIHRSGDIEVAGTRSQWVPPTPAERGYPAAERVNTYIRNRSLPAAAKGTDA
jgi:3',5'-cyclic AMP phosphodiesterase CpdA